MSFWTWSETGSTSAVKDPDTSGASEDRSFGDSAKGTQNSGIIFWVLIQSLRALEDGRDANRAETPGQFG
jgi:hypothetical protein